MNDYYPAGVTTDDIDRHFGGSEPDIDKIREMYYPEDIFTNDQLIEWAHENGFQKV